MLTPRLTTYPACATVTALLIDIDCRLTELASTLYNNIIYSLNQPIPAEAMMDLLNYKRILMYKFCNSDYAPCFTVEMIASRVKLLKYK